MLMQQTITNLWLTVHALTVIQQWIQQLVKSQMKVGMRLTQTERLVRRMPTMVLLQQSSRVNQWTLSQVEITLMFQSLIGLRQIHL